MNLRFWFDEFTRWLLVALIAAAVMALIYVAIRAVGGLPIGLLP